MTQPKEMHPGLITSINTSHTLTEIEPSLLETKLQSWHTKQNTYWNNHDRIKAT